MSAKARRRKFTGEYKLSIVEEAARITDPGEIGALLRREGLYSSHLVGWRRLRATGALGALSSKRGRKPTDNPLLEENQKLKSQVVRLEKRHELPLSETKHGSFQISYLVTILAVDDEWKTCSKVTKNVTTTKSSLTTTRTNADEPMLNDGSFTAAPFMACLLY